MPQGYLPCLRIVSENVCAVNTGDERRTLQLRELFPEVGYYRSSFKENEYDAGNRTKYDDWRALLLAIGLMIGTNSPWCVNVKGMMVLIALIMISAVCFAVYNELLAYHPISKIAIFNALIPVLGVIFSALLLKEELKWQYFIAVMMVACGIYLVNKKEHR